MADETLDAYLRLPNYQNQERINCFAIVLLCCVFFFAKFVFLSRRQTESFKLP